uniref:C3H1-type domain-containing protein n=1 Tax=Brassica oleracea var. oleracea TaxID=109376 RepID=A0A0D3BBV1_BRAOL
MELLGQPACGNFKAYGFCKYGARCKFDHPVPVNPYHYAGLTMPSQPTAHVHCTPPVSTHVRITSPPSRSDSTTVSNGDKSAAENQTSENEKEDDGTRQKCKNTSSEAKKGGKDPSAADNSRERDTSDNAAWS